MTVELGVLIGIVCTVLGTAFGYFNWQRANRKEIQLSATDSGEMRSDIKYIKQGIEDIKVDMRVRDKEMGELTERVVRVEESAKQAHKRIDEIKKGDQHE